MYGARPRPQRDKKLQNPGRFLSDGHPQLIANVPLLPDLITEATALHQPLGGPTAVESMT